MRGKKFRRNTMMDLHYVAVLAQYVVGPPSPYGLGGAPLAIIPVGDRGGHLCQSEHSISHSTQ